MGGENGTVTVASFEPDGDVKRNVSFVAAVEGKPVISLSLDLYRPDKFLDTANAYCIDLGKDFKDGVDFAKRLEEAVDRIKNPSASSVEDGDDEGSQAEDDTDGNGAEPHTTEKGRDTEEAESEGHPDSEMEEMDG
ncbi:uncharacterized protein LOC118424504 [Branchiostoma floridae]|uniref:Uncharacterized protein LOC118424504 n=1 Tax=Branchiostoma floridae TaxID=7739 RepID=A0A9J7LUR0_BRAFL|nr:uncharacterized protein LOC118424504 [Branchiostoma floridae]